MQDIKKANSTNSKPVNLITMRMAGHAKYSGYDRLIDYLEANKVYGLAEFKLFARIISKIFKPVFSRSGLQWYHRENFVDEFFASGHWLTSRQEVFHYLYGENSYRYLGNLKSIHRQNAIVCTYHTPPDRFKEIIHTEKHLYKIDAIVAVSTMQLDFLSKYTGYERTFFVPHGIDVEYFKPSASIEKNVGPIQCLFVGTHLRDLETLVEAALILKKWGETCKIVAISSPKNKDLFARADNIELRTGITDEELLALYQQSSMLLLPLLEATANNSVLEALACGLPIVSTDLQGVRDYVNSPSGVLVQKQNPQALAEAVVELSRNPDALTAMGVASRKQALTFSWQNVANQFLDIYNKVSA